MEDNKLAVASVKLAEYAPPMRVEKENYNRNWVELGEDNLFPDYILALYRASNTNHAVIDKLTQMITGKGIHSNVANGQEQINSLGLNEELPNLVFDHYTQGGFYLEVIRSKSDEELQVKHLPFENCRLSISDDEDNEVDGVWYSNDWSQIRKDKYKPEYVPLYDPSGKDARSVIFVFRTTPGSLYYPSPSYEGAINYIEAEIQIGIYHNNQLLNGLMPSFFINFRNGQPDLEARNNITRELERKISGVNNAGKFITTFNEPGVDTAPTFEAFPLTDASDQYQFLSKESTDQILRGHRVTNSVLFGVKGDSGLGNNANEMAESKRQMEEDVIFPDRMAILKGLTPLFQAKGIVPDWGIASEEVESDVERSYTGIQISSAIEIINQVNSGLLTVSQAMILVQSMLGFDESSALALFEKEIELSSKKKELTEDWGNALADGLEKFGHTVEEMDEDGWELVGVEDAGTHEEEGELTLDTLIKGVKLASITSYASPGERSDWGDSGLYKLRYRYSQNISTNSRSFCSKMVGYSQGGYIFRKEDIDLMSSDPTINGQFAPEGLSTYDIYDWKGGVYCHHKWERLIFFRKRGANGAFLPRSSNEANTESEMNNDKRVANVPFVPQKGMEGKAPINTPSRGSLKHP